MNKLTTIATIITVTMLFAGCRFGQDISREDAIRMEGMMPKEDQKMVEDAMKQKESKTVSTPEEDAGSYRDYSPESVKAALSAGKKVVLFFHAPWCPTCKAAELNFLADTAPSDIVVFKVDYDSNVELKKKYGVTYQHTFVSLNADETLKKKSSGEKNYTELVELF